LGLKLRANVKVAKEAIRKRNAMNVMGSE